MKRILCLLLLLGALGLCGCAAGQSESVFLVEDALPASAHVPACFLRFSQPPDSRCTASDDAGASLYEAVDGSYRIQTAVYPLGSPDTVLQTETGFSAADLHPTAMTANGRTEYRYCWWSQTEEGLRLYGGVLLYDGQDCYCLQFSVPEQLAKTYAALAEKVLRSAVLYEQDGISS